MISKSAAADIEEIVDYIAINLQEPAIALKQIDRIKGAMMSLQTMPESHSVVFDKHLASKGIRLLLIDNYLAFYTANKSTAAVNIVRVLYGRRAWETLLM